MGKRQEDDDKFKYLAFVVLLVWLVVTVAFIIHHMTDGGLRSRPSTNRGNSSLSSKVTPDKVGRHLRSTTIKKMMEEQRIDNELTREEAKRGLPDQATPMPTEGSSNWPSIDADPEQASRFRNEKPSYDVVTPQDQIQEQLIQEQQDTLEGERQREEFIRQFKENARHHGVDVQIDKNLKAYPRNASPQ